MQYASPGVHSMLGHQPAWMHGPTAASIPVAPRARISSTVASITPEPMTGTLAFPLLVANGVTAVREMAADHMRRFGSAGRARA